MYLSIDPFSKVSQTDETGPNAEINEVFFVQKKKEKKVEYKSNEWVDKAMLAFISMDTFNVVINVFLSYRAVES